VHTTREKVQTNSPSESSRRAGGICSYAPRLVQQANGANFCGLACLAIDEGSEGCTQVERALTVGDDARQEPEVVADVHLRPPGVAVAPVPRQPRSHRAVPLPASDRLAQRPCSRQQSP
jgi:hypothetical protein